jgi:hypothetical protein
MPLARKMAHRVLSVYNVARLSESLLGGVI